MKCPNCGADIKDGSKFCEFCGSSITANMKRDQEYVNKAGCPKCGSSNIKFDREKQGEIRGKKGTAVVRSTVGFCKDCGYTWHTAGSSNQPKKKKTWLWVLGWICIFPLPLTILLLRKKDMKPALKYGIIAVAWIIYLIIGLGGNSSDTKTTTQTEPVNDNAIVVETEVKDDTPTTTESHIYDNAEILDMMNGTGTEKIGTVTVVKANQADCTEEALYDWYVNYVKKNADSNYHVIVYNDVENKGVYSNGFGFIQKDITITPDNGTYMTGDDAGSTYYIVDETTKTLTVQASMADESIVEDIKAKVDAVIPAEYKNSDLYSVDVAGKEGSMDCNLTLVNEAFAGGDCQDIAVEIATKVKELDLGIGYFCIAFQSDDYTMTAISNIDDLSNQEATEISTKAF